MQKLHLVPFLTALLVPSLCPAEESCPWLEAATAESALGTTAVKVTVSRLNTTDSYIAENDAICTFTKHQGEVFRELRLEVHTIADRASEFTRYTARCSSKPVPLKAVGNEAQACSLGAQNGRLAAQVIGRLRDRIFLIQVSANAAWTSKDILLEKTCDLADQISGSLF